MTVGCYKTAENKKDSRKLRAFAWSKTDQEGKLIGPGKFTMETTYLQTVEIYYYGGYVPLF
jgi:hypothetical protein